MSCSLSSGDCDLGHDNLSLSRGSGVPLRSPLNVFWVCVVCSLHPHVVDPGSDTSNFNCHRGGYNNSIWTLPTWGQGVVFPVLDPHLTPGHKYVNLFPEGERPPFLYKLSYLIYYLTQLFLLL